jgi:ornithine cyclodeaminase/alanine dehydrogenase-like protein (mu-crystallin family)
MTRLLSDEDVRARLTPETAVEGARTALVDAHRGDLQAPPRVHAELGARSLVFTVGGLADGTAGFRVYQTGVDDADQAVLVWGPDGGLAGCIVGTELGAARTGALGAAAVDALARSDAEVVGVVGSGRQAWTQLWAATAVRRIAEVRVFSPTEAHRERFAERARDELGLAASAVGASRDAVDGADVVIFATRSETPVIEAGWVSPGAHVNTVGPKAAGACETPPDVAEAAAIVVSDSPAQAAAYGAPFFTSRELVHLGAVIAGEATGRTSDSDITLYASTGLAGSEVVIARRLLEAP